jgi:hypothetical protein
MKKVILLILLICGLLTGSLSAQDTVEELIVNPPVADTMYESSAEVDESEWIDTALVSSASVFSKDSIRAYKKQESFAYMRNLDSTLKALQDAELRKKKKEPVKFVNPFPAIRFFLWAIAIAVVVFVIYRLFLGKNGLFAAPVKNKKLEILDEEITSDTYIDQQLKDAIANGNYRQAIRFLYLQTLSQLAAKEWLQLSPDKTNYQYVKELTRKELKNEFSRITLHYEYAWYGDFAIGSEVFTPVKREFEEFQSKVKRA